MYCKKCGKEIDDDSVFCSYCGARQSAKLFGESQVNLNSSTETDIHPVKSKNADDPKPESNSQNVNISLSFKKPTFRDQNKTEAETKVDKYDKTYQKETEATVVAVAVLVIQIITYLIDPYQYADDPQIIVAIIALVNLLWRVIVTIWIVRISGRQNRDSAGWGIFAFILPNLALFIIGLLKKLYKQSSTQAKPETDDNPNIDETSNGVKTEEIDISSKYTFEMEFLSQWTSFWGKGQTEFRVYFSDGNIGKIYYVDKDSKFEKAYLKLKNYKYYYRSKEAAIKALHYALTTNEILRSDDYLYMA